MSEAQAERVHRLGYRKGAYKVGEVCALTGLESHVLRYWENELPMLRPRKSRGGQRLYSPEDVDLIVRIKTLLYDEGYTIAGTARRLELEARDQLHAEDARSALEEARTELRSILTMLEANETL